MSFLLNRLNQFSDLIKKSVFTNHDQVVDYQEASTLIYEILEDAINLKKKIFVIGNGGSSGIASHHVIDLINVVKAPAFSLSDSNILTCIGNDYGYPFIFSRPLDCLANDGDVLIAISSSGKSPNILSACDALSKKEAKVVTLSGFSENNPLRSKGVVNIWTGENDYGLVETAHFFILHTIIDGWLEYIKNKKNKNINIV